MLRINENLYNWYRAERFLFAEICVWAKFNQGVTIKKSVRFIITRLLMTLGVQLRHEYDWHESFYSF